MPKQTKTCRVCGATYEACNSIRTGSKVFNWREVACSPECGMAYLERISVSRSIVELIEEQKVEEVLHSEMTEMHSPLLEPVAKTEVISEATVVTEEENDVEVTE